MSANYLRTQSSAEKVFDIWVQSEHPDHHMTPSLTKIRKEAFVAGYLRAVAMTTISPPLVQQ